MHGSSNGNHYKLFPPINSIQRLSKYFSCALLVTALIIYLLWLTTFGRNYNDYLNNSILQKRHILRIALIAPLMESVPPKKYGGTERVVYYLVEEMVRRGHQVTLFAANDSETSAKLIGNWPAVQHHPVPDKAVLYNWIMSKVRKMAHQFDILHFHTDFHYKEVHDIFADNKSALVMTMHGWKRWAPVLGEIPIISISNDQRTHSGNMKPKFIATVYHGLPPDLYEFIENPEAEKPYLAFLGRIASEKLPDWAIQIAVKANMKLKMAAKVEPNDDYWFKKIKPMIDEHKELVEFVGELTDEQKNDFLGNAQAFIFPINWPEPFGLVMIEAMACGTPVIARRTGSVPEIVEEGVTGFLFDTIDQAVAALNNVSQIDRTGVRKAFDKRFTVEKMADGYEQIYNGLLAGKWA